MKHINPQASIENVIEGIHAAKENAAFLRKRYLRMGQKHNAEVHDYVEVVGDTETGVTTKMTGKEARITNAELERKFTQALRRYKGAGERPRLSYYKLLKAKINKPIEPPDRKLWEAK